MKTRAKPRPLKIDWSTINRAMDLRTRADFDRLHSLLYELMSDVAEDVAWSVEMKHPPRPRTSEKAERLKELLCEIPWLST
jgi:hypothetical protein